MDYKQLSHQIVEQVGGRENIANAAHCATRLRLKLNDDSKFNEQGVKALEGVVNILHSGGQYQIIIGPHVQEVYEELISDGQPGDIKAGGKKFVLKDALMSAAQFMGACMGVAILPMIGAGLIKAVLTILLQFGWIDAASGTYTILYMAADAIFVFMPIFLAIGAARKLGANEILAVLVACIMVSPAFATLVSAGNPISVFGIPVQLTTYTGTYLPAIFTIIIMALLERLLKKILPKSVQTLLVPFLIVLIMTPIALCATGPFATWLATLVAKPIIALANYGWLIVTILACFMPLLIMFGLHGVIVGFLIVTFYMTLGYDAYFMVAALCSHFAIGTVAITVGIKSKNAQMKQVGFSTGSTMLLGNVSEPAIFGVLLQSPAAMISACAAGAAAGLFAGIVGVKCYAIAGASVLFIPCFIGEQSSLLNVLITVAISVVSAFVLTMLLYKDPVKKASDSAQPVEAQS